MNARAQFAQIGETPEYAAPALRRSLSEIVAEYDEKAESGTNIPTGYCTYYVPK